MMKRGRQKPFYLLIFFIISIILALPSWARSKDIIVNTKKNWFGQTVLSKIECSQVDVAKLFGAILSAVIMDQEYGNKAIVFYVRDIAVTQTPRTEVWSGEDLIRYYKSGELPPKSNWNDIVREKKLMTTISMRNHSPKDAFLYICEVVGYECIITQASVFFGPKELVGDHHSLQRRAYFVTEPALSKRLNVLPKQLEPVGACCGYNEADNLLCLIASPESFNSFEDVFGALGLKPADVKRSPDPEI